MSRFDTDFGPVHTVRDVLGIADSFKKGDAFYIAGNKDVGIVYIAQEPRQNHVFLKGEGDDPGLWVHKTNLMERIYMGTVNPVI